LFLLATFGFALAGSSGKNVAQGALSAPYTGNGAIRLGDGNWGTLSNTSKYSVLLASANNANLAGAAPGRALMYACGTNTDSSDAGSAACGVSYSTAVANNWILKDSSGNYIHYRGAAPVLLDIGSASYQQRFIADIDADLRAHPGVDGLWLDDIVGNLFTATAVSPKYPTNASYRAAMISFMNAVGPALRAKGWFVAVNASMLDGAIESTTGQAWDGSQYIWWINQIAAELGQRSFRAHERLDGQSGVGRLAAPRLCSTRPGQAVLSDRVGRTDRRDEVVVPERLVPARLERRPGSIHLFEQLRRHQ
jgi:hypothetical protein